MMGQSFMPTHYSKIFRMSSFINKRMRTAVVVAAAKINNKKVETKLKIETYLESSQTSTTEFLVKSFNY